MEPAVLWTIGHSTLTLEEFTDRLRGERIELVETEEFEGALARLADEAAGVRAAIMCAEAPWWRCHRALIADTLKARGVEVMHIMDADRAVPHPYTTAASVVDGKLYYGPLPGLFG